MPTAVQTAALPLLLLIWTVSYFSTSCVGEGCIGVPVATGLGPDFRSKQAQIAILAPPHATSPRPEKATSPSMDLIVPKRALWEPPRPALPDPEPASETVQLSTQLSVSRKAFSELQKQLQCWAWNGRWIGQKPNSTFNYRWAPDASRCETPFRSFEGNDLCTALRGRPLRLVGDSITNEHFMSLAAPLCDNSTMKYVRGIAKDDPPRDGKWVAQTPRLSSCKICNGTNELSSVRTDRLLLDTEPIRTLGKGNLDFRWSEEIRGFNGVIVVNRGAHFRENDEVLAALNATTAFLREHTPNSLIFFRTTPPGHAGCVNQSEPIEFPQPPHILPFNWQRFWKQNVVVADLLHKKFPGVGLLDVTYPTALKADGHRTWKGDCLHYATTESYTFWNDLLGNALLAIDRAVGLGEEGKWTRIGETEAGFAFAGQGRGQERDDSGHGSL